MKEYLGKMRKRRRKSEEYDSIADMDYADELANIFMDEFIKYYGKSGSLPVQVVFSAISIFIERLLLGCYGKWTEQLFDDEFAKLRKLEKRMRSLMSSQFLD